MSVPDEVYREARIRAAERGSSVGALVRDFLCALTDRDREFARLETLQRCTQDEIANFRGSDRLGRDEIHGRAVG